MAIKIEKVDIFGWEAAIRGLRNPLNSWDKSDSLFTMGDNFIGENDLALMRKLVNAGSDHSKFMRMINVTLDITAPLYWWKEFDTYKVGTVANSCSTMHKIHAKKFTLDDFSRDHLFDGVNRCEKGRGDDEIWENPTTYLETIVNILNYYREKFIADGDKSYWWQLIQLLPSSYNQKRTVQLNYAVLRNMYHSRKNHKLDEWHTLCEWIEGLPYSELITA